MTERRLASSSEDGEGSKKERITKGHKETLGVGGDGYVHYLDYGNGFTGVHICQNLSNCIPEIRAVYYMTIILLSRCFLKTQ